jgi:hypothetical protein
VAQEPATPRLEGVVERGAGAPLAEAAVILHRVDALEAGEIDSLRADAEGRFVFDLPTVPDPGGRGEVYFASVRHDGVVYFGPPVMRAVELDSLYRIQVYDTVTAPPGGAPVPLGVRYILAEPVESGWQITDLFQLDVIGERTWVESGEGVTWRYPMPAGIGEVQVGGGDLPPELTTFPDGALEFSGPLSPGSRQVVLRYMLDSLVLSVPIPGGAREMEFLIQEPAPSVTVTGLAAAESVEMEPGVTYRRYAGVDLGGTVVQIREGRSGSRFPLEWLAVLLGLGLAAFGIWAVRRTEGGETPAAVPESPATPVPWTPEDRRRRLILEAARIDEELEETDEGPARARLEARREELLALLQRPPGPGA